MKENLHKDMDQFFKEKFNNREFEFKEAYWTEMTDLLEEETEQKAVGFPFWKWILSGIALLIIGATVWSFAPTSFDQSVNQSTAQPVMKRPTVDRLKTIEADNNKQSSSTIKEAKVERRLERTVQSNQQNNSKETKQPTIQKHNDILKYEQANTNNQPKLPIKGSLKKGSLKKKNQPSFNASGDAQKTPFEPILPDFKTKLFNNQLPIPMKMEGEKPQASSDIFATAKTVEVKPYLGESLTSIEGVLEGKTPTFENLKYPLNVKSNNWKLGLLAGTNTVQNYSNGDMNTYTTRPIVGLTSTYTPHPNWSVNSGILYHARGGVNTTYTIDSIFFAFGVSNNRTEIDVTTLHYIEIPLQVGYNFGKRKHHQLTTGIAYAYLMNASGTSTNLQTISANSLDASSAYATTSERTSSGYQNVFRPHDLSVQLGYNVEIYKDIKIGISANYGLVNVGFSNDYQDGNQADPFINSPLAPFKNIYFRAAITYNLINF